MTNFQVYKKTLSFSFVAFLVDLVGLLITIGFAVAGFFILNRSTEMGILGIVLGFLLGGIIALLINAFITNRYKAAQIAMMVKGVTEDKLPDHTFKAGMDELKGRFGKITAFYFITRAIKGIFNQIGRTINKIGTAVGGDAGNAVTSAINAGVQTVVGYLCDCCLGWVLFRKDVAGPKAGCEGAVIFFKHGKTLIRNVGRIFGMGLLSLLLIGGAFFGLSFAIFSAMPQVFQTVSNEIVEIGVRESIDFPSWVSNPTLLTAVACAILGIIIWSMLHSLLIRPFILTGVLRNFMAAGIKDMPTEADFKELDAKSPKFAKLHQSI